MGRPKTFNREEFLRIATELFWKKGFAVAGLAEIQDATGVSKSSIYAEFEDKDDIFNQCIRFYRNNLRSIEILQSEPRGWKNIEAFLKTPFEGAGRKGCLFANSVREYDSIPERAKTEIARHTQACHQLLVENITATKSKKDPALLANSILTFSAGVALKLNAARPDQVLPEVDMFMELIKK